MTKVEEGRVHQIFETIYQKYDLVNAIISFGQHKAWRCDTVKRLNVEKGQLVLDLCCGTGDLTIPLAKAVGPQGKVIGLDFSHNMLAVAAKKMKRMKLTQVELMSGNALRLTMPSDTFDKVTIGFGLRNLRTYPQAIKQAHRVLKDGGMFACLETSRPKMFGIRHLYSFYLKKIMPRLGTLLTNSYPSYAWLQESTMAFSNRCEVVATLKEIGFINVTEKLYALGAVTLYIGQKKRCN